MQNKLKKRKRNKTKHFYLLAALFVVFRAVVFLFAPALLVEDLAALFLLATILSYLNFYI